MKNEKIGNNQNNNEFGLVRILLVQVAITGILATIFWVLVNNVAGYSSLLGGLISCIPNVFLGARIISSSKSAKGILRAAYIGEAGKVILTVLFFGLVFLTVKPLNAMYLFTSFIVVQFSVSVALLNGK
ncbi:MAG: ATP synthase subunit I [Pseudomonadota bacterium]|nr:ATP synthase subunit I [Pseudomonadota bacterium]